MLKHVCKIALRNAFSKQYANNVMNVNKCSETEKINVPFNNARSIWMEHLRWEGYVTTL